MNLIGYCKRCDTLIDDCNFCEHKFIKDFDPPLDL